MGNSMEEMDIIVNRVAEQPENKGFCFRWNLHDEKAMTRKLFQGWEVWKPADAAKARKMGIPISADGTIRYNEHVLCRRPQELRDKHYHEILAKPKLKEASLQKEANSGGLHMTETNT